MFKYRGHDMLQPLNGHMNNAKRICDFQHVCAACLQAAVWVVVVTLSPEVSGVAVTSAASSTTTAAQTSRQRAPPVRCR